VPGELRGLDDLEANFERHSLVRSRDERKLACLKTFEGRQTE
jgi:hypothetical protein